MISAVGILLVDDDPEDHTIIADAVQALKNATPLYFESSGMATLQRLESMYNLGLVPCLVVVDLNMPKMGGAEVLRHLKKDVRFYKIPVIIYSTSINKAEKESCLRSGAHSYITKPLSYQESLDVANQFLELCCSVNGD